MGSLFAPLNRGELLVCQIDVDHHRVALSQSVLDEIDGREVGVSTAQHLHHWLGGRVTARGTDLRLALGSMKMTKT